jgi:phosphohistidine phosphatase
MRVYFVRHGEPTTSFVNPERPLTSNGKLEIAKLIPYIQSNNIKVNTVYHSGKARARETAEILCRAFDGNVELVERPGIKPDDPVEPFVTELRLLEDDTMFVGHQPFLEYLMGYMFSKEEYMDKVHFRQGEFVTMERDKRKKWKLISSTSPHDL